MDESVVEDYDDEDEDTSNELKRIAKEIEKDALTDKNDNVVLVGTFDYLYDLRVECQDKR